MISTATAAVNAMVVASVAGGREPEPEGGDGEGDDDRHEDAGHPVGQPLHLGLARLGVVHQPGDLGERGVGADARGLDHEAAAGVDGGAR